MSWDTYKAKKAMLELGMDHIKDGLYAEGGELIGEVKWGDACDSEEKFIETIQDILCWDLEDILEYIDNSVKGNI